MRNICECDICGIQTKMITNSRIPENWQKIDYLDLCVNCKLEFKKRYRKMIRDLIKEKSK